MQNEGNRGADMALFAQVGATGNFSATARNLSISPSAVSQRIARLEARLGTQLFQRSTRPLTLTEEGKRFFARTVRILAQIEVAELEAKTSARK